MQRGQGEAVNDALTEKQAAILSFIGDRISSNGRPPSLVEIAKQMGVTSPNAAREHIIVLARKGYVHRDKGRWRSLRITEKTVSVRHTKPKAQPVHRGVDDEWRYRFNDATSTRDSLRALIAHMAACRLSGAELRVIDALLPKSDGARPVPTSLGELAASTGIVRRTVSRALANLGAHGFVKKAGVGVLGSSVWVVTLPVAPDEDGPTEDVCLDNAHDLVDGE